MWAGPSMFLGVAMVRYSQRFDTLMRGVVFNLFQNTVGSNANARGEGKVKHLQYPCGFFQLGSRRKGESTTSSIKHLNKRKANGKVN